MRSNTWDRLEEIFFQVLNLPTVERAAFLDVACTGDPDLRAEVDAVLASHLAIAAEEPIEITPEDRVGSRVGAYRLEALIGRGGMGEVYRAIRVDELFEQEVAVKLVRSGLPAFEMIRRFRLERQILARLEHPNVAPLLDGGVTADGLQYLVMQFVHGAPITTYADAQRLSIRDRLRLFVIVCQAVQYAHSNLVVHRDLKPSNILVTEQGEVRLLDFGIAKLLDPEGAAGAAVPTESLLLLTPEHAAPEQFLGQTITTATDVYQLGILLYELLTGTRPFQAASTHELHRVICEAEPTRPSAAVGKSLVEQPDVSDTVAGADAARARSTTIQALRRQLRGDLDRIVLMALRKEPERRYSSAADLAEDIDRHLEGYPVRARPESIGYVSGRFVRRHKVGVAASLALAASLVALAILSMRFAATTSAQATEIARERDVALQVSSFLEDMFAAGDPYTGSSERRDTLRIRDFLDEGARAVREELGNQPLVQARLFTVLGRAYRNLGQFESAQPLLQDALALRTEHAVTDSIDTAASRVDFAQLLIDQGKHDEAETQLRAALAVLARDSTSNARRLAITLGILGNLHQERGEYSDAEGAYRSALTLSALDSASDGGRRAEQLSNLATALTRQAKNEEAERLLRQAIDLSRAHFGNNHPTTATLLNNLGSVLRDQDKLDEAEPILREALAIRRTFFQPPHPLLAISLNNLAELLLFRNDLAAAAQLFRESLDMRIALNGEIHPSVGIGWINLAAVQQRFDDRRKNAVDSYARARHVITATLGPQHPLIGAIDGNLGRLYHDSNDHARALQHLRAALEVRNAAFDKSHPTVLGTLSDIGRCLTELRRFADAESVLLETYAGLEPRKDQQARAWDAVLLRLATLYRAMGREADAARYQR